MLAIYGVSKVCALVAEGLIAEGLIHQIDPNVKKDKWSKEEDDILIEAHGRLGNHW